MTRLGRSAGFPAACRRARHRHFSARAASITASLDPVVEQPVAASECGEFHRLAIMLTQRASISAVCGYSSLSIMFLSAVSAMSRAASWWHRGGDEGGQVEAGAAVEQQSLDDRAS